jgi:hypothetical protein
MPSARRGRSGEAIFDMAISRFGEDGGASTSLIVHAVQQVL